MNLYEVKSLEGLKALGNHKDVAAQLREIIGGDAKIKTKSWKDLYDAICSYRKLIGESKGIDSMQDEDQYFISKEAEIIFYLIELDGETRLKKLGISKIHYRDRKKAAEWRNDLAKVLHPDKCNHSKAKEATSILNRIYKGIVEKEGFI